MANLLEKYGIKEVADVTFYEIMPNGTMGNPVLFLDTLKVSTLENTAENTSANGGKGNSAYVVWDYGRDITVTLEDALFSAKSMALAFGGKLNTQGNSVHRAIHYKGDGTTSLDNNMEITNHGFTYKFNGKPALYKFTENGLVPSMDSLLETGSDYLLVGEVKVNNKYLTEISANTFPGLYYITGETYARSQESNKDEFFQFIIPKAKLSSETTITMEADGEPSVLNLTLRVLYNRKDPMMKLVKYKGFYYGDPLPLFDVNDDKLLDVNTKQLYVQNILEG